MDSASGAEAEAEVGFAEAEGDVAAVPAEVPADDGGAADDEARALEVAPGVASREKDIQNGHGDDGWLPVGGVIPYVKSRLALYFVGPSYSPGQLQE